MSPKPEPARKTLPTKLGALFETRHGRDPATPTAFLRRRTSAAKRLRRALQRRSVRSFSEGGEPGHDGNNVSISKSSRPRISRKCTRPYPFCPSFQHRIRERAFPVFVVFWKKTGVRGGIAKTRVAEIDIPKASDLAIPRKSHARLCRRARSHGGQHWHRLSRVRARIRRRGILPQQRV